MGITNFPDGASSFGIPIIGAGPVITTGSIFFVHSGTGNSTNAGTDKDKPLATIDAAINKCTADKGDIIFVLPGHAESIAAAGIDADIEGITIYGLGNGDNRPTITLTATSSDVDIDADNVTIANLIFKAGIDAIVAGIDANKAYFKLINCKFIDASTPYTTLIWVLTDANADYMQVLGCEAEQLTNGPDSFIKLGGTPTGVEIAYNRIVGDYDDAGIHNATGNIALYLDIHDNYVRNLATGQHAIELVSACTGVARDNRLFADTLGTIFDPGSLFCTGNMEQDAIDEAGVMSPRTANPAGLADGVLATGSFAADFLSNAKIADDAFAAEQFKADCITNAKIADSAFGGEQFALSAGEKTNDGIVVTKATAALPQTTAAAIFTVTGLVLVRRIVGYVTTVIGAAANATKLVGNSTGAGASTDLCATLELNACAADSRLEITGTFANAMVKITDIPAAITQAANIVVPPGTIDVNCAGSDGGTGRVRWSITYVPWSRVPR